MGLKTKKGISFTIDALISVLIVIIILGVLPYLLKNESKDVEVLLMKRYSDSVLTALDNNNELDSLLWVSENQGKNLIKEDLDNMLTPKYNYNVYITIDTNTYDIVNDQMGEVAIVSRRLFFDTHGNIKRGYIELEVWRT